MAKRKEKDIEPKKEITSEIENETKIETANDMGISMLSETDFLAAREDVVKRVLSQQPDDEILYDLAELFKVFGDSTRIKILYSLFETELCVYDIARLLNLSQSSVSHQLRILKTSKLVKFRRDGKSVFYSLDDEHVRSIISMGMEHVEE